ncbi:hypothetical protein BD410DRAFT_846467 [Rickenella mellea]|uniref:Uncharacterized protein n=1 Tax=Rickenella mellea TaxID=50990 RepID=A0A4Y7PHS6_9AGAM|nr:hypothetical protein BD410DRAFT_846467 [Rickenella mellea]
MQSDPIAIKVSELLRLGMMPSAEDIKSGKANAMNVDMSSVQSKAQVESAAK